MLLPACLSLSNSRKIFLSSPFLKGNFYYSKEEEREAKLSWASQRKLRNCAGEPSSGWKVAGSMIVNIIIELAHFQTDDHAFIM